LKTNRNIAIKLITNLIIMILISIR